MKYPLWLVAPVVLVAVACGTTHTGTLVRSTPPTHPVITHTSSSSLPADPACFKPGVLGQAKAIAAISEHDQAKAVGLLRNASADVKACMSKPTGEVTESGSQQVSP